MSGELNKIVEKFPDDNFWNVSSEIFSKFNKSIQGVNFTNILWAAFLYESAFLYLQFVFVIFLRKENGGKNCL